MAYPVADDDHENLYEAPEPAALVRAQERRSVERIREARRLLEHTPGHENCPGCAARAAVEAEARRHPPAPFCPKCGSCTDVERLRDDEYLCDGCNVVFAPAALL